MKKIMYIFSLIFVSLLLIGCQDNKEKNVSIDVDVTILDEAVINHHIHIYALIPSDMDDEASLHEIMNDLANQMYFDYLEQIDGRLFYLYLHGYDTQVAYEESDDPFYGTFVYGINLNITRPGLSFVRVE